MIVTRPPMGWNSWNTFGENIDEKMILETADTMVKEGLLDAGYNYLVIDDCWSMHTRDENGKLVADPVKFPHGMKYVADYVHSKGLKFGMYSCAGVITCAGYPASYEHEFTDAATFAEWGVDFLKYDYCFHDKSVPGAVMYRRMALALANCGRDILFSACNWGADKSPEWIKSTGAHMWRSTGDINDSFGSIKSLIQQQLPKLVTNGMGCFNDMDMLVVGMNGEGFVSNNSGITYDDYVTHFAAWAMFQSPLMIGCDIRKMTPETKAILLNKDVIAIDQDEACRQVYILANNDNEQFVAVRHLENGDLAIGVFNLADHPANRWTLSITLAELGLNRSTGKTLHMKELFTGEEFDVVNEFTDFGEGFKPHHSKLFRATLIDAK